VNAWTTLATTFLAACVEVIEMVIIVVGVGSVRGWRSTLIGGGAGFGVLLVVVAAFGTALAAVPIGPLRLVVGALLLVFGLQWLRKGIRRVAHDGFSGSAEQQVEARAEGDGMDWTAFTLSFKGVFLEGLEVAFIAVSFGETSGHLGWAVIGAVAALAIIGVAGALARTTVQRIPRAALQLVVGTMLASFGTFWAAEGIGVGWPGSDAAILGLLVLYVATAAVLIQALRSGWLLPDDADRTDDRELAGASR
jgi:uncharacterized membrane protein